VTAPLLQGTGEQQPLRVLMFGYCFFRKGMEPAIGVYKRLVRVGMELVARGHRVDMHIVHLFDDDLYTDPLIERASKAASFSFLDLPIKDIRRSPETADWNFHCYTGCIADVRPDVIVVGEVPLLGDLLAQALAAVHSRAPVVVIDNTYCSLSVSFMAAQHGPLADALVLVGPSAHELQPAPPFVHYAPPFAPSPDRLARPSVEGLAADGPTMTVLGYDPAVRELGLQLALELGVDCGQVVVVGPDPDAATRHAASLGLSGKVVPLAPPSEELLFSLLHHSRLAVVKGGFMQVTECLSLGTPVVAYRYGGSFSLGLIPEVSRRYVVGAKGTTASPELVAAARALLAGGMEDRVHDGPMDGVGAAADAVESAARAGVRSAVADCEGVGISRRAMAGAVRSWWGEGAELVDVRCTQIRDDESFRAYATVVHLTIGRESRSTVLLCRVYGSAGDAADAAEAAPMAGDGPGGRYVEECLLVERWQEDDGFWPGEHVLPWRKKVAEVTT
jgi:hypothetical protein